MQSLKEFCQRDIIKLPQSNTILEASTIMAAEKIGAILVTDKLKVCGVFTERDLLIKVIPLQLDPSKSTLSSVMSSKLITIPIDVKPTVALEIMFKKNIRHLPITDDLNDVIGIVSMRDLLRYVVKGLVTLNRQMQEELDQLRFLNL